MIVWTILLKCIFGIRIWHCTCMPFRFWFTDFLSEIFDHVTQNLKDRHKSYFRTVYQSRDPIVSDNAILVHLLLFEWTKMAYSKTLKVDQNRDFEEFWVTWSKILERKSVNQNRDGMHVYSRDYLLHTRFWTKKWTVFFFVFIRNKVWKKPLLLTSIAKMVACKITFDRIICI